MKRSFLWIVGGAGLLLAYVQLQITLISSGYKQESLKEIEAQWVDQHRVLQYNVLILRSPVILSKRLGERRIQLKPPSAVEMLPGKGALSAAFSSANRPSSSGPAVPRLLTKVGHAAVRWLEGERQAEAEPAP